MSQISSPLSVTALTCLRDVTWKPAAACTPSDFAGCLPVTDKGLCEVKAFVESGELNPRHKNLDLSGITIGRRKPAVKYLFIFNDSPYGDQRAYNGLRLAVSLSRKAAIRVFRRSLLRRCSTDATTS